MHIACTSLLVAWYKVRKLCTCEHHQAARLCLPAASSMCSHPKLACLVSLVYLVAAYLKHNRLSSPIPYATPGMACLEAMHTMRTAKHTCFAKLHASLLVSDKHFCQACSMQQHTCGTVCTHACVSGISPFPHFRFHSHRSVVGE